MYELSRRDEIYHKISIALSFCVLLLRALYSFSLFLDDKVKKRFNISQSSWLFLIYYDRNAYVACRVQYTKAMEIGNETSATFAPETINHFFFARFSSAPSPFFDFIQTLLNKMVSLKIRRRNTQLQFHPCFTFSVHPSTLHSDGEKVVQIYDWIDLDSRRTPFICVMWHNKNRCSSSFCRVPATNG